MSIPMDCPILTAPSVSSHVYLAIKIRSSCAVKKQYYITGQDSNLFSCDMLGPVCQYDAMLSNLKDLTLRYTLT